MKFGNQIPSIQTLEHVLPQLGHVKVPLFSPASDVYTWLRRKKEPYRLGKLRHLGAVSFALPGARQARWDYVAAKLYYATRMRIAGLNSSFRIGRTEFSSANAALQCISLVWNAGHIPGTFACEKGLYRYLFSVNPAHPVDVLSWPMIEDERVKRAKEEANRFLLEFDYRGMARVLGALKLLSFLRGEQDEFFPFVIEFAIPFLLEYDSPYSIQWEKLRTAFRTIRHLAYLTIDGPMTGLQWSPAIPLLVSHLVTSGDCTLDTVCQNVSEILSPFERMVHEVLYHSPEARRETIALADTVYRHLRSVQRPLQSIDRWLGAGLLHEMRIGHRRKPTGQIAATIRLRSHFSSSSESPVSLESGLVRTGFNLSGVFQYEAWNSETVLEPDETIIDVVVDGNITPSHVGKLSVWFFNKFDRVAVKLDDAYELLRKAEMANAYKILFSRAIELAFPGITLRIVPWDLRRFNIMQDTSSDRQTYIWATTPGLDDALTKHILRDRTRSIEHHLRDSYEEVRGLSQLRFHLLGIWQRNKPRRVLLFVAGSVRFCKDNRELIEYDGGLLTISSRSGKITWYGLETKRGSVDPARRLERKLRVLGVCAQVERLTTNHACASICLM